MAAATPLHTTLALATPRQRVEPRAHVADAACNAHALQPPGSQQASKGCQLGQRPAQHAWRGMLSRQPPGSWEGSDAAKRGRGVPDTRRHARVCHTAHWCSLFSSANQEPSQLLILPWEHASTSLGMQRTSRTCTRKAGVRASGRPARVFVASVKAVAEVTKPGMAPASGAQPIANEINHKLRYQLGITKATDAHDVYQGAAWSAREHLIDAFESTQDYWA